MMISMAIAMRIAGDKKSRTTSTVNNRGRGRGFLGD
jgi:hypothetical protein